MKKLLLIAVFTLTPIISFALPSIQKIKQHGIIDIPQIIKLYTKAQKGDAYSQADLGGSLINGSIGVLPNYERGLYWLNKSAAQGCALAYFNLALLYLQGNGVPKDEQKFYAYERLALSIFNRKEAKNLYTSHQLATLRYFVGNAYFWGIPGITKQNFEKAFREYLRSADDGFAHSIEMVAFMLRNGIGIKPNPLRSHMWTKLLATAGNVESQYQLGIDYLHGFGTIKDTKAAVEWISKASRTGYFPATVQIYKLYKRGLVKFSAEEAKNIGHVVRGIGEDIVEVLRRNPLAKI